MRLLIDTKLSSNYPIVYMQKSKRGKVRSARKGQNRSATPTIRSASRDALLQQLQWVRN